MYPIDFLWRSVARCPDRLAVIGPGIALSFSQLGERVASEAAALTQLEPTPRSRIGLGAYNSVDHLIALLAIMAAGKVWVPLNPLSGDPELLRIVSFVKPALVLADPPMASRLTAAGCRVELLDALRCGAGDPAQIAMGPLSTTSVSLEEAQAIKFTGGSTGVPKGVLQPLRSWNTNIATQIHELRLNADDRYLVAAPITHGTGTYVLPLLGAGGALVFPDEANPAGILNAIAAHRATLFFGPATLIMSLAAEQTASPRDLSSLRYIIYGGAPMRPAQIRAAQGVFGPIICTSYGQTEAPQMISILRPSELTDVTITSVGRPSLLTEVAIIDETGQRLPPGSVGEIAVRGDLVMSGYLDSPGETARTLVDGWLRTGDAGEIDENGFLFIRDRLRDVIITGGFNVYPSDVEAVICRHPDVFDSAVVGIPDEKWGEAVHAAVQLRPGAQVSAGALTAFIKADLGSVKTPKAVHFVDALPRSAVNKVLKNEVRELIRARAHS